MPRNIHKGIWMHGQDEPFQRSGKNYLLVIAIDEYVHCPPLNNCVKDARDLIGLLTSRYQFEEKHIFTLFNEKATRPNIHNQFKQLREWVGKGDNLLIYFSGHGQTEDDLGYWVPVNAHPEREWEFFSTDEIRRRLDAIKSFHTLVIVDACFSGSLFATYKSSLGRAYENKRSRLGLAASHSRERALDGRPGENSPFAENLLRRLRESQQAVAIQQLATDVIEAVTLATQGRQTPVYKTLDVKGDDAGQFVFHLKADEEGDWSTCLDMNTISGFQQFINKYADSTRLEEAKRRLTQLREESSWQNATQQHTISAYLSYRRDYPQGVHRAEALSSIQKLEEEQAWERATGKRSVSGYEEYLDKYPAGKYLEQALRGIDQIIDPKSGKTDSNVTTPKTIREAGSSVAEQEKKEPEEVEQQMGTILEKAGISSDDQTADNRSGRGTDAGKSKLQITPDAKKISLRFTLGWGLVLTIGVFLIWQDWEIVIANTLMLTAILWFLGGLVTEWALSGKPPLLQSGYPSLLTGLGMSLGGGIGILLVRNEFSWLLPGLAMGCFCGTTLWTRLNTKYGRMDFRQLLLIIAGWALPWVLAELFNYKMFASVRFVYLHGRGISWVSALLVVACWGGLLYFLLKKLTLRNIEP
ncbi:MAG: caspase family protein [Saprospiraceae bacterium]